MFLENKLQYKEILLYQEKLAIREQLGLSVMI